MPVALLALSTFAIGITEFVIMGLLPEVTGDLRVSIPSAGWLISGYALSVTIGAPIMALLTARLPRKKTLILLMYWQRALRAGLQLQPADDSAGDHRALPWHLLRYQRARRQLDAVSDRCGLGRRQHPPR